MSPKHAAVKLYNMHRDVVDGQYPSLYLHSGMSHLKVKKGINHQLFQSFPRKLTDCRNDIFILQPIFRRVSEMITYAVSI
jgi:hypothetical protein